MILTINICYVIMSSLKASEKGRETIKQARNRKGWKVEPYETRPLKEASKFLIRQHGDAEEWNADDPRWLRDLENLVRGVEKTQEINQIKIEIAKSPQGSLLERIERFIDSGEVLAKDISYGSWSRFASQTKNYRIKERAFKAYCEVLGLQWQEIADKETDRLNNSQAELSKKLQIPPSISPRLIEFWELPD